MNIIDNVYVAIDYRLSLENGEEIDCSSAGEPFGFITGSGQVIPGLENALKGLKVGDSSRIIVEPEEGYGMVREDLIQEIPRSEFPDDATIEQGMTFEAEGPHGPVLISVAGVNPQEQTVTVDLNHPLAGKRLCFDVSVVEVRQPTPEELAELSEEEGCSCGCSTAGTGDDCGSGGGCGPGCGCR